MKRIIAVLVAIIIIASFGGLAVADEPKIRIGVIGFDSKADGVSQEQANIIMDLFTRTLASSKSIAVYERERLAKIGEEIKLSMSGLVDMNTAVEVGRIAGVQYILMGSVTELSERVSGGAVPLIFIPVAVGSGGHEARATIDIRIIDTTTSETRLALSESGSSSNTATAVAVMGMAYAESEFGGLQARAISDAVNRLAHAIRAELGGESSHVISVSGNEAVIDVGSNLGVKEGQLYLVYTEGKTILGMSGESLGREKLPLAVIKVREVSSAHSNCVVATNCSLKLVKRGDKIEPISAGKAKGMKFVTSRPAASSETFEQIFGKGEGAPVDQTPPPATEAPKAEVADSASKEEAAPKKDADAPVAKEPEKQTPAVTAPASEVPGFDPNSSTDVKVIQTYGLDMGTSNMLKISHANAMNSYKSGKYKDAYEKFTDAAGKYEGHYLAAYWAGMSAHKLKKTDESLQWINKALAINPQYKPASEFKSKTLKQ